MASYKYKCENCGEFEIEMPMSEYKPLESCPTCSGKVERVIGIPMAMIFKGEGFHINDYKKKETKSCDEGSCSKSDNGHHEGCSCCKH
jgi:putative FmdB family regulatory protein